MSDSEQQYLGYLIRVTGEYTSVVFALLVWEHIITFKQEYQRIWKAPWGPVKALFLFNRYWALIGLGLCEVNFHLNIPVETCLKLANWEPGLCLAITLSCELILLVRAYALWDRNRFILFGLGAVIAGETVAMVIATTKFVPVPLPFGDAKGPCIATGPPGGRGFTLAYWIAPMFVDLTICAITFVRAWQLHKRGMRSRLFTIFIRYQGIYMMLALAVNAINTGFYLQSNPNLQAVNSTMSIAITSILASRLVLSLRDEEMSATNQGVGAFSAFAGRTNNDLIKSNYAAKSTTSGTTTAPVYPLSSIHKDPNLNETGRFELALAEEGAGYKGIKVDIEKATDAPTYKWSDRDSANAA